MNQVRDEQLGAALRSLDIPQERSDLWVEVRRGFERTDRVVHDKTPATCVESGLMVATAREVHQEPIALRRTGATGRPAVHTRILAAAIALLLVVAASAAVVVSRNGVEPGEQQPVASTDAPSATDAVPATTALPSVSLIDYGNLTYASTWMDDDVTLIDGAWAEPSVAGQPTTSRVTLYDVQVIDEGGLLALVYLRTDLGESGTFYDMYAITEGASGLVVSKPVALGDRISEKPTALTVVNGGTLSLTVVVADRDGVSLALTYLLEGTELMSRVGENETKLLRDVDVLDNLSYPTEWLDGDVSLSDGEWVEVGPEGSASATGFRLERAAYFELPRPLALVILSVDPGGSGTFYDLYAVTAEGTAVEVSQPVSLGDRVTDFKLRVVTSADADTGLDPNTVVVSFVDRDGQEQSRTFIVPLGELILVN